MHRGTPTHSPQKGPPCPRLQVAARVVSQLRQHARGHVRDGRRHTRARVARVLDRVYLDPNAVAGRGGGGDNSVEGGQGVPAEKQSEKEGKKKKLELLMS